MTNNTGLGSTKGKFQRDSSDNFTCKHPFWSILTRFTYRMERTSSNSRVVFIGCHATLTLEHVPLHHLLDLTLSPLHPTSEQTKIIVGNWFGSREHRHFRIRPSHINDKKLKLSDSVIGTSPVRLQVGALGNFARFSVSPSINIWIYWFAFSLL